ncbi:MAG: HAD family hydrolase [Microbacteriaceae bacterium]
MSTATPQSRNDDAVIAFFDVDNTLLRGASIYHLAIGARRLGLLPLRDILTFAWHQLRFVAVGENHAHLSHVRERAMQLVGGHSERQLIELAKDVYSRDIEKNLWPETVAIAREHLERGHEVWLITASPQLMAQVIADRLGLTGALGTMVESVNGIFTGKILGSVLHGDNKAAAAHNFLQENAIDKTQCWAYSDSRNDIPLLSLVGNRVAINPDAALSAYAQLNNWPILRLRPSSIRKANRASKLTLKNARRDNKKRQPGG